MSCNWWRCNRSEASLIAFGWAWWDVPALMIPNYYSNLAMASFYQRYGLIRADIA